MSESIPAPAFAPLAAPAESWARHGEIHNPGVPSQAVVKFLTKVMWPILRAGHRPVLSGLENLPERGPFLLVANHSGALGIAEILAFTCMYLQERGADKPLAGFAHPAMFHMPPASLFLREVGAVPSTYEAARATLAKGVPLLVFPGGDHEVMRPIWQASRVDFNGRLGFLRLAQSMNVPIVPMGIRGSHYTAPVLWRSDRWLSRLLVLPALLGVKRFPITVLGLFGLCAIFAASWALWLKLLLAWAWSASLFPLMSWIPWSIRMRVGQPISPEQLFAAGEGDEALRGALKQVETRVAELVREA